MVTAGVAIVLHWGRRSAVLKHHRSTTPARTMGSSESRTTCPDPHPFATTETATPLVTTTVCRTEWRSGDRVCTITHPTGVQQRSRNGVVDPMFYVPGA